MTTAEILQKQRTFFAEGHTRPESWRRQVLQQIQEGIEEYESRIMDALKEDLGKSSSESYMCEVGLVREELKYMLKHLHRFMRRRHAVTPLAQFASDSYMVPEPYGNVLVMSPWNYPFLLSMDPVIDAVAAGNTVLLKPSAYSPATSKVMAEMFARYVAPEAVAVVTGGRQVNADLLDQRFDYIFFTGGKTVGRMVMEKASRYLTPVTLELGGKSPCIVDETADLKLASRRIVFGKYLNLGQTCVAPDYILVHESVKDKLMMLLQEEIRRQFGEHPLENPDYGHIINRKHYDRLCKMLMGETVLNAGGITYVESVDSIDEMSPDHIFAPGKRKIAPVVLTATPQSKCMQEEIFGPILPVLTYKNRQEVLDFVEFHPRPLSLYLFSSDKQWQQQVLGRLRFGGGCINDVVIHLATTNMPFGGVGESGMGGYHGKYGFDTFTHYKSIVDKKTWLDLPMRYQPYTKWKDQLIRWFVG